MSLCFSIVLHDIADIMVPCCSLQNAELLTLTIDRLSRFAVLFAMFGVEDANEDDSINFDFTTDLSYALCLLRKLADRRQSSTNNVLLRELIENALRDVELPREERPSNRHTRTYTTLDNLTHLLRYLTDRFDGKQMK